MKWLEMDLELLHTFVGTFAKHWLKQCNLEDLDVFKSWFEHNEVRVIYFEHGLIFVTDYYANLRCTIHPLFYPGGIRNAPQKDLDELADFLHVLRIEVRLFTTAGKTLRRWLRKLGFTKEGTLQNAEIDYSFTPPLLISVEVWAMMRLEFLEELYGSI